MSTATPLRMAQLQYIAATPASSALLQSYFVKKVVNHVHGLLLVRGVSTYQDVCLCVSVCSHFFRAMIFCQNTLYASVCKHILSLKFFGNV